MSDQIDFYNNFGKLYKSSILNSEDPARWTTDTNPQSRINMLMKERTDMQERTCNKYFKIEMPVLDLGCGFGRQTFMLAKNGFSTVGVDSSMVFTDIGRELFRKHNLNGVFLCDSVISYIPETTFSQVTLFDVIEHFEPSLRGKVVKHIAEHICSDDALVIFTFPFINPYSVFDTLMNMYKTITFRIEPIAKRKEHPYPLPTFKSFSKIIAPWFETVEYFHSTDTAFFVLKKLS